MDKIYHEAEIPAVIKVGLGIAASAKPTLDALYKRAIKQLKVVAGGNSRLAYLQNDRFLMSAKLGVALDGNFILEAAIPTSRQLPLLTAQSARSASRNLLRRNDSMVMEQVAETYNDVSHSANLVERVSAILNASPHPQIDLFELDRNEGVSTLPARQHIFERRGAFQVLIDDRSVEFPAGFARTSVEECRTTSISIMAPDIFDAGAGVLSAVLLSCESGTVDVKVGRPLELRLDRITTVNRALLGCAGTLRICVDLEVVFIRSTYTLKVGRAMILRILNAGQILDGLRDGVHL